MKRLAQLSSLPVLVFALLSADVHAGAATASGLFCRPNEPGNFEYKNFAFVNNGANGVSVSCAIPMDNVVLGEEVTFRMRVEDKSNSDGFDCRPIITDELGGIVSSNLFWRTTGVSETGWFTLASNWEVEVPGNVNTNMYAIYCAMPGNGSTIFSARVQ